MLLSKLSLGLWLAVAPAQQREVLVLTTSTLVTTADKVANIAGYEVQNLGPNAIFCNIANAAVLNKSRRLQSGEAWGFSSPSATDIYCIAATANQVTGAATIVTTVKRSL